MMRRFGGNRDQECNGWVRAIVIQNIFIIVPLNEEGRMLLLGCGIMKMFGVIVRRI